MECIKIVFMGSSEFSLKSLEAINKNPKFHIIGIYTRHPKPSGRKQIIQKTPTQIFGEINNIPVFTPKTLKNQEQTDIFQSLKCDVTVVSSYGLIIPENILNIPPYGFINVHASLLPKWRGAAPIQASILAGDQKTGITIMKMDAGLDTGDIISMESIEITQKTNHGDLSDKMASLGGRMIVNTLENLDNAIKKAKKQPDTQETYANKLSKEDCKINWNKASQEILRQIMAFSPTPGAWSIINNMRVKILDANVSDQSLNGKIGSIFHENQKMLVKCSSGAIEIEKIQVAGKNAVSTEDFLRGYKNVVGNTFE